MKDGTRCALGQVKGPCNAEPSRALKAVVRKWFARQNNGLLDKAA
jgi:hypothetical protein